MVKVSLKFGKEGNLNFFKPRFQSPKWETKPQLSIKGGNQTNNNFYLIISLT